MTVVKSHEYSYHNQEYYKPTEGHMKHKDAGLRFLAGHTDAERSAEAVKRGEMEAIMKLEDEAQAVVEGDDIVARIKKEKWVKNFTPPTQPYLEAT